MPKLSQKSGRQILGVVSVARAERLLTDWANLKIANEDAPLFDSGLQRLFSRYPEILYGDINDENFRAPQVTMAAKVRLCLRKAWEAADRDPRRFEWYAWKAAEYWHTPPLHVRMLLPGALSAIDPPATPTVVEAALFHLRNNRARALICPGADCPAPYFFAAKKNQRYCSVKCAAPAQREAKRKWWAVHKGKGRKQNA